MKKILLIVSLAVATTGFAQVDTDPIKNTDKMSTTVITKTITKSSNGTDVSIKKEVMTAEEALALEQDGSTNQAVNRKPLVVTTSTTFISDGMEFLIKPDAKGFVMSIVKNGDEKKYGIIRKMSRPNAYLLVTDAGNAFGYFNSEGDFVVESYDPAKDMIVVDSFAISEDDLRQ